jgi:hypothetical protein
VAVILGFDPGGRGAFGWCVTADHSSFPTAVLKSGTCNVADEAVVAAFDAVPIGEQVVGAGIDAPLVWSRSGSRKADRVLRKAIQDRGARSPGGTVQEVNSLRGACVVQGVLTASALRRRQPGVQITESHPKVLRLLLDESLLLTLPQGTEHERDAALATLSGWACIHQPRGWSDLFRQEEGGYHPVEEPLSYWMPV